MVCGTPHARQPTLHLCTGACPTGCSHGTLMCPSSPHKAHSLCAHICRHVHVHEHNTHTLTQVHLCMLVHRRAHMNSQAWAPCTCAYFHTLTGTRSRASPPRTISTSASPPITPCPSSPTLSRQHHESQKAGNAHHSRSASSRTSAVMPCTGVDHRDVRCCLTALFPFS